MKTQRYKELDAMRGFAALFVMFFHYTTHTPHSLSFLELGVTGVDLFFIISGFVIFMSINKVRSAKEFMINRFA
ncbi:MAG: acyltransferase family protein, partial [Bacteroidia bacterium]